MLSMLNSKDGSIGAYASADLSIGVFDTINLQVDSS
jgi:hypothetical protein